MSDLLVDHDLATQKETAREPAKRWRNKWRIVESHFHNSYGWLVAGDTFVSRFSWPTRDVAETKAQCTLERYQRIANEHGVALPIDYLGAFSCDENGEPL